MASPIVLNGTPEKRLFWSIISDYDLGTALCELVDNCIDIWSFNGRSDTLKIQVNIDPERQLIELSDNAGGIQSSLLHLLITPGGTGNDELSSTIGVFGVGIKRAVVAIAECTEIRTRHQNDSTFLIKIDEDWLQSDTWQLEARSCPNIRENSTLIRLSMLRYPVTLENIAQLKIRLSETYSCFLGNPQCQIFLNSEQITPTHFDHWCYPPDFPPHKCTFPIRIDDENEIIAEITAGLISDRDSVTENYGVYFYCNDRLIVKELKTKDVGYYNSSIAGIPHPDASLCRVIVHFAGAAKFMPWNSSKTNIVPTHQSFIAAAPTILKLIAFYTKLSRSLKRDWEAQVFRYTTGEYKDIPSEESLDVKKIRLPAVPKSRRSHIEIIKETNQTIIHYSPYCIGLIEAITASEQIQKMGLETGNRISLILIDSTFEIALKEYIVHNPLKFPKYDLALLFNSRSSVLDVIKKQVFIDAGVIALGEHYYNLRNKLIHEKADVLPTNGDVQRYRDAVKLLLTQLFNIVWP